MKKIQLTLLLFLSATVFGQNAKKLVSFNQKASPVTSAIPSLDELSGDWMPVDSLLNFPSVMNFVGGLQTSSNLVGFRNLTISPFAQGGLSCELFLNGKSLKADKLQWRPYEVCRKVTSNEVEMVSTTRMPFEQQGVLIRLILSNHSKKTRTLNLSMNGSGRNRLYPPRQWRTWGNARPDDSNFVASVDKDGKTLVVADKSSSAVTAYSFTQKPAGLKSTGNKANITWLITLPPGKSSVIELAYAIGANPTSVISKAKKWSSQFNIQYTAAKTKWEERWQNSFKINNDFFSGHYPTLITDDSKMRRIYYESVLVPLLMCRTNFPFSRRCFVTAGPQYANTLVYFWDTEMWAHTWAMLEPETMREQLAKWFLVDFHKCYAVECLTGEGAGPWYAANDWSIFRCIEAYLEVTGDTAFLHQMANGNTILQHLDKIATYYESRPLTEGSLLANYGGPDNLLECSPSYIQGVPSLNAANVFMLRKVAGYYEKCGNINRANALLTKAKKLLTYVMSLYQPGQGVWNALDTNGKRVPIRHCYDYITIGQALEKDLSPQIKSEMNRFVETELLTKTWMRAMSLKDPAALKSDRPDHGPMGSYDAWPPMTMDVMCRFGAFYKALAFLHATEDITHQGPWAQSHEFVGPNSRGYNPIVRTASRGGQDANEGCGAAFAEVIIRSFFGFRPDVFGDKPLLLSPAIPRGFNGKLEHIPWHGKLYTIVSDIRGVHLIKE